MHLAAAILAATTLGLASTTHCAAMCGPLAAVACRPHRVSETPTTADQALPTRSARVDGQAAGGYFVGRLLGYTVLGGLVGALGSGLSRMAASPGLRVALGLMVASVLCVRAWTWISPHPRLASLRVRRAKPQVSKGPGVVARLLSAVLPRLPRSRHSRGPFLGVLTALLPCGASFAALLAASQGGSGWLGALMMATFAVASAPGLLAVALVGARMLGLELAPGTRGAMAAGLATMAVAAWIAITPMVAWARASSNPGAPSCHCPSHGH